MKTVISIKGEVAARAKGVSAGLPAWVHDFSRFQPRWRAGDRVRVSARGLLSWGRCGTVLRASTALVTVRLDALAAQSPEVVFTPWELAAEASSQEEAA